MFVMHDNILTFLSNEISEINNKIILIKDSDELSLNKIHDYLLNINFSNKCFYKDLKKDEHYEPYYPFLSFIKEGLSKSSITLLDFLDANSIYPSHKEIFSSYIAFNKASREEELIPFDYEYEKNKLYESFLNIFNEYSDEGDVYVLLENINYMTSSTLDWMKWLVKNEREHKFKIIFTITSYEYYKRELQDEFENFIEMVESKYSLLEVNNVNGKIEHHFNEPKKLEIDLIDAGENLFQFLALNESLYCLSKKYGSMKNNDELVISEELEYVLSRLGDIYLLKGDYHNAHIYYDLLLNKAIELKDEYLKAKAFQKIAMLDISRKKFNTAEKYAKNSYKIAINLKDDYLKLKSYELLFWINELGKYRTTIENLNFEEEFIILLKNIIKRIH